MTKRTVCFLSVNSSYSHTNLAAWYLQAFTADLGWKWETVELIANEDIRPALNRIAAIRPAVLAATFYLFNRSTVLSILRRYRALDPGCRILAGGPEFLGDNRAFAEEERCVDAVVRGEGETAFRRLLADIDRPELWRAIPGICGILDGKYTDNGVSEEIEHLDDIPSPYTRAAGARRLRRNGDGPGPGFAKPFIQLETSRGCRNRCAFCTSGRSGPVRCFSPARVRSDVEAITAAGVRHVRIVDRTFNDSARRAAELIRMFRDDFPEVDFHLEIDPAKAGAAVLDELAAARPGQFHLDVGVQTFDHTVTNNVGRAGSEKGVLRGLTKLCGMGNIAVHADLIAALPGGTLGSTYDDLRRLVSLRPAEIQLEVLKLLPGTRLSDDAKKWGIVASPEPPYEALRTREMTADDVYTAHLLSKMVDWFYGPSALRDTICRANDALPSFWRELVEHEALARGGAAGREADGRPGPVAARPRQAAWTTPSLENRFRLLEAFFTARARSSGARCSDSLLNTLRYAWMKHGLSQAGGICNSRPWKAPLPEDAVFVEGDRKAEVCRMFTLALDSAYIFAYGRTDVNRQAVAVYRMADG